MRGGRDAAVRRPQRLSENSACADGDMALQLAGMNRTKSEVSAAIRHFGRLAHCGLN